MRNICLVLILAAAGGLGAVSAHERPMIDRGYPKAPPTVDPGPDAATLNITVVDSETNQPVSATVSVNGGDQEPVNDPYRTFSLRNSANRHKGPISFRKLDYYFFTDGKFTVRVPPGICRIRVGKGYEYRPSEQIFNLEKRQVLEATITLNRWIDMANKHWYSGDLHLHLNRTGDNEDVLFTLLSARDIKYGFILSMNTRGYDRGKDFETWVQAKGLGEKSVSRKGPYHLSSGQEYRPQSLGHVNIVMADRYVPGLGRSEDVDSYPSLALIADQAHQLNGFIGLNHGGYDHREADSLGLTGKMDFLELLQFGGYRGLGLEGWYDFLSIGYRWPIVAGSDFPYTRELGDCVTYIYSEERPTVREFVEKVARGASFVTSGPMLWLRVNGKRPGSHLTLPYQEDVTQVDVQATVLSPLYPVRFVEIIVNGEVVSRHFDRDGRTQWEIAEKVPMGASGWIAARAYGDAGTDSHTNAIYLFKKGERPFDMDACDRIISRLSGSIRTIPNQEIKQQLRDLRSRLENYRDRRKSEGLALPGVPLPDRRYYNRNR